MTCKGVTSSTQRNNEIILIKNAKGKVVIHCTSDFKSRIRSGDLNLQPKYLKVHVQLERLEIVLTC